MFHDDADNDDSIVKEMCNIRVFID